ncbi:hypothetical protein [Pseudoduganella sp. LjRoot289]|uniref:hypothetical protein n=1 Tax=Pseudoduganella sp. LjRoot289 TaxID=3342314 RepID=UPI003F4FDE82
MTVFLAGALTAGCAWSAPDAPAAKAIEDVEPEVTKDVAAALARKAEEATAAGQAAAPEVPLLRACPAPLRLELLRRSVDGEERSYLYRVRCPVPLLASATYGKAATIKRLSVVPEWPAPLPY